MQMFEGQQQLLEARDEADDVRERIEAAEAEAERAKQAEAVAQQAAAEAFANSATTPRSRMSPASPERRKVRFMIINQDKTWTNPWRKGVLTGASQHVVYSPSVRMRRIGPRAARHGRI